MDVLTNLMWGMYTDIKCIQNVQGYQVITLYQISTLYTLNNFFCQLFLKVGKINLLILI